MLVWVVVGWVPLGFQVTCCAPSPKVVRACPPLLRKDLTKTWLPGSLKPSALMALYDAFKLVLQGVGNKDRLFFVNMDWEWRMGWQNGAGSQSYHGNAKAPNL